MEHKTSIFAMDTLFTVNLSDNYQNMTKDRILNLQTKFDRFSTDGELYSLNQNRKQDCSEDIISLIQEVNSLNDEFGDEVLLTAGGLTDIWDVTSQNPQLPNTGDIKAECEKISSSSIEIENSTVSIVGEADLDFGAIAKGFALDRLKMLYDENNLKSAIVSSGSSTLLYGDIGRGFVVDIRDPFSEDKAICRLTTKECFISTSGSYERYFEKDGERYHHILDLKTGYPSNNGIASVTVICDSGIKSDFLSTLIFIDGAENIEKHLNSEDYKIIAVLDDGSLKYSEGLDITIN